MWTLSILQAFMNIWFDREFVSSSQQLQMKKMVFPSFKIEVHMQKLQEVKVKIFFLLRHAHRSSHFCSLLKLEWWVYVLFDLIRTHIILVSIHKHKQAILHSTIGLWFKGVTVLAMSTLHGYYGHFQLHMQHWPLKDLKLSQRASNCKSLKLSFQVSKSEFTCKSWKMSKLKITLFSTQSDSTICYKLKYIIG
jgi:hypothetical protein